MSLFQTDIARFATVLVFYPIMAIIFIVIAIRIIKRNRRRLNVTFSLFYISIAIGVAINMLYALIQDEVIVLVLHYIATYFVGFGLIFLLTTNRILLQSAAIYSAKQQIRKILIYAVILAGAFLFIPFDGVVINASTEWRPIWNPFFYIYITAVHSGFVVIPIIVTSFKIRSKMTERIMRKRWNSLLLGIFGLLMSMYLTFLSNFVINTTLRLISALYAITIVIWAILIYRGVGKQL